MNISEKRKKTEKYLLSAIEFIDKNGTGENIKRYQKMFSTMSDTEFDKFMNMLRKNKTCIHMYYPNMTKRPTLDNIIEAAKKFNVKLFHRLKKYDNITKKYFITNEAYPVFRLPIRRMQQFLEKKISVPKGDSKVDTLTGQVSFDDRSAKLTNPEIQALQSKGLSNSLHELLTIRGGNIEAYSGEMKRQAEETGTVLLKDISGGSKTRSAVVAQLFFEGMMLESNFVGEI
jgi:hypothetical protein